MECKIAETSTEATPPWSVQSVCVPGEMERGGFRERNGELRREAERRMGERVRDAARLVGEDAAAVLLAKHSHGVNPTPETEAAVVFAEAKAERSLEYHRAELAEAKRFARELAVNRQVEQFLWVAARLGHEQAWLKAWDAASRQDKSRVLWTDGSGYDKVAPDWFLDFASKLGVQGVLKLDTLRFEGEDGSWAEVVAQRGR